MRVLGAFVTPLVVGLVAGCGGGEAISGDPGRGKAVYAANACSACHTLSKAEGRGRDVGPNLDEVAKRYDADFIRESIVNPSAYLEKGGGGTIGGSRAYGNTMLAWGPDEKPPQHLTEQQLADLVAFIESAGPE